MANRKEDEKNERIIRSLLKLPDNRRCVNCNSLGPQYVCVNFWTFICTNCSGIHREFTHRVKSVSMAKFTSQEVSALQGGGNASAKEIYLKEWDPQRQSLPDGSNVERLRDFIKHVYVERRYTGERSLEKPPKPKMNESEDFNDHRLKDYYQGGSRSPPYDEAHERRYSDKSSSGGRSPGYDVESRQHGDYQSPARTEVVNDWRREDRFGTVRKSEDTRTADGGSRPLDSRSPDRQRDLGASSPPVVRPVREILGENIAPLRVIEPPKANGFRSPDSSIRTQRTESSSSLASSNGNPAELRTEASLIDFDDVPAPPVAASPLQPQPPPPPAAGGLHTVQTAHSDGGNWARFDSVADVKISQAATNVNPLESVIAELTVPFSASLKLGSGALTSASTTASNIPAFPSMLPVASDASPFGSVAPTAAAHPVSQQTFPGGNSFGFAAATFAQQPQSQQQYPFPAFGGQSVVQSFPVETSNNQPSIPMAVPNQQWFHSAAAVQMPQSGVRPNVGSISGVGAQSSSVNAVVSERKALPEDLFAVNYSQYPAPVRGWHPAPQYSMGFPPQYNMPMPVPTYPQPQASKSTNPFDVGSDPAPAAMFPSASSLQGALPTMSAPGGQHHVLHGAPPSSLNSHAPPHPTLMHPNVYMGQQLPGNMPSRPHGQGQFGLQGASGFGAFSANPQQLGGGLQSTSYTPNTLSSSAGGNNPFG